MLEHASRQRTRPTSRPTAGRVRVLGSVRNEGSERLVQAWRDRGLDVELLAPGEALAETQPGDTFVARLDVLPTLDGVEPGLLALLGLERRGVRVVNPPRALLAAHDKLRTAKLLGGAGVPHPATEVIRTLEESRALRPPVVVKPRFGSWGRDVFRCDDAAALARCIAEIRDRSWFRRHGALVQELVPPAGEDLRVLVANGRVVGAARRTAAPGEWRTNVSLGGALHAAGVPEDAGELARTAAAVTGLDLVGVDLMPAGGGTYTVLELNAAVEFDARYSVGGVDVYTAAAEALELSACARPRAR